MFSIKFVSFRCISYVKLKKYSSLSGGGGRGQLRPCLHLIIIEDVHFLQELALVVIVF